MKTPLTVDEARAIIKVHKEIKHFGMLSDREAVAWQFVLDSAHDRIKGWGLYDKEENTDGG